MKTKKYSWTDDRSAELELWWNFNQMGGFKMKILQLSYKQLQSIQWQRTKLGNTGWEIFLELF